MTATLNDMPLNDCASIRAYLDAKYPHSLTATDDKAKRLYYMECAELYATHAIDLEAALASPPGAPVAWVSVSERLPADYERVWVQEKPPRQIEWEVTHWLPLSALPVPPATPRPAGSAK